jgi:hypothetical protein
MNFYILFRWTSCLKGLNWIVGFLSWPGGRFYDWKGFYSVLTGKFWDSFLVALCFHILSYLIGTKILCTGIRRSEREADHPYNRGWACVKTVCTSPMWLCRALPQALLFTLFYFIKLFFLCWTLAAILLLRSTGKHLGTQKTVLSRLFYCRPII